MTANSKRLPRSCTAGFFRNAAKRLQRETDKNHTIHHTRFSFSLKEDQIPAENAKKKLRDYLSRAESRIAMKIENGKPDELILQVSEDEKSDLVIRGLSRNDVFCRYSAGKTVERPVSRR